MDRRTTLKLAALAALGAANTAAVQPKKPPVSTTRNVLFKRWNSDAELSTGTLAGLALAGGALTISAPVGQRSFTDPVTGTSGTYDYATWTSPMLPVGFTATEAIASWTASTPGGTWLEIRLRGVTQLGNTTKWYIMGVWAADDTEITRTSVSLQGDTDGFVSVDTFVAAEGHAVTSVQVEVALYRPAGTTQTPQVRSMGMMASQLPEPGSVAASTPALAQGVVLPVPQYSQHLHDGHYPQWDNGGEAWCSPTSTSMVVAHWGTGPTPADYAWVDPSFADPWVDYAARNTFDYTYSGCGNWPFNSAYAGRFGLEGFVTRLRSLNEAEKFIAAGIPLVLSLSFKKGKIPGLSYGTNGHLLVLVGFTATGQPVLNDPAAVDNPAVRKIVGRAEFEAAWLDTSGGITYVIHPSSVSLPTPPGQANW
ncbi:C39 family peptidase [Catelliglobosispora koreensis]|uniref:C39 family peptidase n=1 Tax=Catelliglobosispora koreensis TaxID=129052 RepID=UPI00037C4CEC|nr:C39 family peptidase [Catelliglobosispora koreensis]